VITVTGSTGTIGSELVRLLSQAGVATRAIARSVAQARALPHVTSVAADLRDLQTLDAALLGTERLFLLTGNDPGFAPVQIGVVGAAARAGVRHLVKLSALGASDHSKSGIARAHWEVEQAIQRSAIPWTMLRPHAFMQNWLGEGAETVRAERVIYSPIGEGRVPFIDTRDIAAVAAKVLLDPRDYSGKKFVLTGGAAVGYADVAEVLSRLMGKTVTYRAITMEEARARLAGKGVPAELIDATLAIAAYQRDGGPTALVSPTVERLLGRPPRTIEEFVRDHLASFM
jgi:NAD(P)H dehydrogenase (quinone)